VTGEKQVASLIREAVRLHGHLGPFLVIGVRMGICAERSLNLEVAGRRELRVSGRIPFSTPFSCALDGIQVTTNCTIGNQKLRVEKSRKKMVARFELQGSDRVLCISVNPKVVEELVDEMSKGVTNEELAARIVSMPEQKLFAFEKQ